ncbi:MAG: DUF2442 domain-containing protein [bacterium]
MKSKTLGENILEAEVTNISMHGFWLYVNKKEYFLSYDEFPWFKDAKVSEILDVQLLHNSHLYWQKLDVDLEVDSLENREEYPLVYR